MKELTKNKLGGFFLAACAITLLTAVVRTACLFWFYEPNVGYFREGLPSVLVSLLYVLGLAVCICPLLLLPRKQLSASRNSASRTALTLRVPAVVAFFVCGIFILGNSLGSWIIPALMLAVEKSEEVKVKEEVKAKSEEK